MLQQALYTVNKLQSLIWNYFCLIISNQTLILFEWQHRFHKTEHYLILHCFSYAISQTLLTGTYIAHTSVNQAKEYKNNTTTYITNLLNTQTTTAYLIMPYLYSQIYRIYNNDSITKSKPLIPSQNKLNQTMIPSLM